MLLSYAQRRHMYEHGYVSVPGVVPKVMVDAALRAINHSLGEGLPQEEILKLRAQSYCRELQTDPVVTDLLNKTPAWTLGEEMIGQLKPRKSAQIALRFPGKVGPPGKLGGHLDGLPTKDNGVPVDGKYHNFTALCVILLSRLDGPFAGNFTVWPSSHRKNEQYFRERGPESFLNDGMPKLDYGEPVQITGEPGDVVFAHYSTVHTAAPNFSPHVRYAAIYRLEHNRRANGENSYGDVLTNIWKEWPGMREFAPEAGLLEEARVSSP
ncbi:MAG: phytanoyl-CoA dioxygenase family protein [Planctomycetes bacterium]|nr:phytanoyl-CoA dioxygenase family protein [Planctomycetota bacterium]